MMPGTTHIPFDRGRMTGSSRPGRKTSAAPPTGGPIMPNKANLRGRDARDWRLGIRGGRHGACRSGECQTNPISCVSASRTSMEMKTKPICRTRRARLGIADWGLGIQSGEYAEGRSAKCQTKPIFRVSGSKTRTQRKTKPICAGGAPAIGDWGFEAANMRKAGLRNVKQSQFVAFLAQKRGPR